MKKVSKQNTESKLGVCKGGEFVAIIDILRQYFRETRTECYFFVSKNKNKFLNMIDIRTNELNRKTGNKIKEISRK